MNVDIIRRVLRRERVNSTVQRDAEAFIEVENNRYFTEVKKVAKFLAADEAKNQLIFLSGPSSAGKSTTAATLCKEFSQEGIDAHIVAMDDFYRGKGQAPVLENGSHDYEALEALRLDDLVRCMTEIVEKGETMLPTYDFTKGRPLDELKPLKLGENSVVIFEGIHAINPYFEKYVPAENMFKLFVNTVTPFYNGKTKLIRRRDIRLIRRMLRDLQFRNSPPEMTLDMWPQVARGESLYMFPYVDTVDFLIDTTHAYEPCLFANYLLPRLLEIPKNSKHNETIERLITILESFEILNMDLLPKETLLREFVGGGIY